MTAESEQIRRKLDKIQGDIAAIKRRVVDMDVVLTDDDLESLTEADDAFKKGRTRRL